MSGQSANKAQVKFRTEFMGYHKEDVINYIQSLQAEYTSVDETLKTAINRQKDELTRLRQDNSGELLAQKTEELKQAEEKTVAFSEQISSLQASLTQKEEEILQLRVQLDNTLKSLEQLKEENAQLSAEAETQKQTETTAEPEEPENPTQDETPLREQLDASLQQNLALNAEISSLQQTIAEQDGKLSERERQISAQQTQIISLQSEAEDARAAAGKAIPQEQYDILKDKAEKYDRHCAEFGDTLLRAKTEAAEILAKAKTDADTIREKAEAQCREETERYTANLKEKTKNIQSSCQTSISQDIDQMRAQLSTMFENMNRKLQEAETAMQSAGSDSKEEK